MRLGRARYSARGCCRGFPCLVPAVGGHRVTMPAADPGRHPTRRLHGHRGGEDHRQRDHGLHATATPRRRRPGPNLPM